MDISLRVKNLENLKATHGPDFIPALRERASRVSADEIVIALDAFYAIERQYNQAPPAPQRGLGDWVELFLRFFGITEARVKKLVGGSCGCRNRKLKLNRLGRAAHVRSQHVYAKTLGRIRRLFVRAHGSAPPPSSNPQARAR